MSFSQTNTAMSRIHHKEQSRLYKRTAAGKYVAVNDPYAYDGLREGWWLVRVQPGMTSIRQAAYPDRAEVEMAILEVEDQLVRMIADAAKVLPPKTPLTPEAAAAWENLVKVGGESFRTLSYGSYQDIAERVLAPIRAKLGVPNGRDQRRPNP